jgi:hypothetical protein
VRSVLIASLVIAVLTGCPSTPSKIELPIDDTADSYVEHWAVVWPSAAILAGRIEAGGFFERLARDDIDRWVETNRSYLAQVELMPGDPPLADLIDGVILRRKIEQELYRWDELDALATDPTVYSSHLNHCLTPILVRSGYTPQDRQLQVFMRLGAFEEVCTNARAQLRSARPVNVRAAVRDLDATAGFFRQRLATVLELGDESRDDERFREDIGTAADEMERLARWLESAPLVPADDAYGENRYARELALAYGPEVTPSRLEELASDEIDRVRELMAALARREHTRRGTEPMPSSFDDLVRPLLTEMEAANAGNQQAFLDEFLELIDLSETFLRDRDLVDLPETRTLFTALSPPHFAGASVGGVYPAGPFNPAAETLFYLPSVPDDAPERVRNGFYRSFNTAFNTMIITHEIYPGHYLQLKAAAGHPSRVRPLFAGDDFTEGWATFCEQMTLDAGWDDDRPITRLAHLRKRLENAVRAYVSVQVHCRGWNRDRLEEFAVETGLLPPQFADNLWHRAMLTPIQLPSYFLGYRIFDEAWARLQERQGETFSPKAFNNAVLASGGIPMDLLDEYLDERLQ